jgi:hypothetical protein
MLRRGALATIGLCAACAWPGGAAAEPVSFTHGTIDHQFTAQQPGAPTGSSFKGTYHAANDPSGDPPYMRGMTFNPPAGFRYDTSVPERCTASDLQLQLEGAGACPEGSRLGGGEAYGKFMGQASTLVVEVFNNEGEQVMLIHTPLIRTVSRGRFGDDGSITFQSPTCYPALVTCPADTALQMGSSVSMPPYVRDGRAYTTMPPKCPKSGSWQSRVRFWWADGTDETVVTKHPCTRPAKQKKKSTRRR